MPVLDCSVKSCYYNKECKCCLDGIHVEGHTAETSRNTACGSFKAQIRAGGERFENLYSCKGNPTRESDIHCEAVRCVFNQAEKCRAEHIGIAGDGACVCQDTECASFVPQN